MTGPPMLQERADVEDGHPAHGDVDRGVEPARRVHPQHAEQHAGDRSDPHDGEHRARLVGGQQQRERRVAAGDDEEDVGVVEALEHPGDPRRPVAAVVDRGRAEEQPGGHREHRSRDARGRVRREGDEDDAGGNRQRDHAGVEPSPQPGLDGVDNVLKVAPVGAVGCRGHAWQHNLRDRKLPAGRFRRESVICPERLHPRLRGSVCRRRSTVRTALPRREPEEALWVCATCCMPRTSAACVAASPTRRCPATSASCSTATAAGRASGERAPRKGTRPGPTTSPTSSAGARRPVSRSSPSGCCRPTTSTARPPSSRPC